VSGAWINGSSRVAEVDPFPATAVRAGLTDKECEAITLFLARNPDAGEAIPGASSVGPQKGKARAAAAG
jgi:hypothetical protein